MPLSYNQNRYDIPSRTCVLSSPRTKGLETPPLISQHQQSIGASPQTRPLTYRGGPRSTEQLEHALREEMIANEEQRNYIAILKNIIESKMERDGILELLADCRNTALREDYQTFGNTKKLDHTETYMTLMDLKTRID